MGTDDRRWLALQAALQEKWLRQVFELFRAAGIEPILIKGWAAGRFYPQNDPRFLGDIDLCVAPVDFNRASGLLQTWTEAVPIDLHNGLRHLDSLSFDDLYSNSKLIPSGETEIRVLRDEDHLRVLAVHWLNDGGAYKNKLKDIHYLIESRSGDFDWDRCLNSVDVKRRRWITCAILLASKYYGTEIDDTPVMNERELPAWLITTVEKEWHDDVRLQPLQFYLRDPKNLFKQLRKRFPPNALQATIEMNGDFDGGPRIFYQVKDMLSRIVPSLKRTKAASKTQKS